MNLPRTLVASLCNAYAGELIEVPGVDAERLLWALSGNESSFGADFSPRHEPAYCHGGPMFNAADTRNWGCLAHCSYGPWQVMFANFPPGISPQALIQVGPGMAEICIRAAIADLNAAIKSGAVTLEQIAEVYNAGSLRPKIVPADYISRLVANYNTVPMPAQVLEAT